MCVQVFPSELEESFKQFTDDMVKTYPLYSGKGDSHTSIPVGYFKVCILILLSVINYSFLYKGCYKC